MKPNEYTLELGEVFHGPMDLLLHLVREQEVEIHEVRLLDVVDGYFKHLAALKELDIEIAGEYMVIAATLMAIKSRSLLPREEVELEDDLDPEDELIQRLLEYRRFKGAADDLEDRLHRRNQEHFRGVTNEASQYKTEKTLDMGELTSFDLLAVFSKLMRETLAGQTHTIKGDPRPLRWYVSCLGDAIIEHRTLSLRSLLTSFDTEVTKEGLIGAFCALLELIKLGIVTADQDSGRDEIQVSLCENTEGDLDDLMRASRFMDEEEEERDGDDFETPAGYGPEGSESAETEASTKTDPAPESGAPLEGHPLQ
ncbi:MAG: segregation/condensation protein A [Planctomycetota bacterium]|nr:segregation/condensation protein A [Planctomycetota bacterium]